MKVAKQNPKQIPEVVAKKRRESNKLRSTAKGIGNEQSCQRITKSLTIAKRKPKQLSEVGAKKLREGDKLRSTEGN
jgi:hypothetical protein